MIVVSVFVLGIFYFVGTGTLGYDRGMLFIFDQQQPQSFWMANTPLSLDMFFVDRDSQIVDIARYTRPLSPESVVSAAPARFVVETSAGYADSRGITEGVRVTWERRP